MISCLVSCCAHQGPFEKGASIKRKEFAPIGSKFFSFIADPFLEGMQSQQLSCPPSPPPPTPTTTKVSPTVQWPDPLDTLRTYKRGVQ